MLFGLVSHTTNVSNDLLSCRIDELHLGQFTALSEHMTHVLTVSPSVLGNVHNSKGFFEWVKFKVLWGNFGEPTQDIITVHLYFVKEQPGQHALRTAQPDRTPWGSLTRIYGVLLRGVYSVTRVHSLT